MDYGKYIIISSMGGIPCPIMFSCLLSHNEVAQGSKVISAGFFEVFINENKEIEVLAFGKSQTLKIGSREEDKELLKRVLVREDEY